jgi:hypothetical protein
MFSYVPKTIPLPTGETLKTSLPSAGIVGEPSNSLGVAYIEPLASSGVNEKSSNSMASPLAEVPLSSSSIDAHRARTKTMMSTNKETPTTDNNDDTKQYLKLLIDEMQSLKLEMNKIQQTSISMPNKRRSDSIQIDLKQLRSDIDHIRTRIAMTPKLSEN